MRRRSTCLAAAVALLVLAGVRRATAPSRRRDRRRRARRAARPRPPAAAGGGRTAWVDVTASWQALAPASLADGPQQVAEDLAALRRGQDTSEVGEVTVARSARGEPLVVVLVGDRRGPTPRSRRSRPRSRSSPARAVGRGQGAPASTCYRPPPSPDATSCPPSAADGSRAEASPAAAPVVARQERESLVVRVPHLDVLDVAVLGGDRLVRDRDRARARPRSGRGPRPPRADRTRCRRAGRSRRRARAR